MNLFKTDNSFDLRDSWNNPITKYELPGPRCVDLFDTNGYDLSELEQDFAEVNTPITAHRGRRRSHQSRAFV
jgi:hypothetical protein